MMNSRDSNSDSWVEVELHFSPQDAQDDNQEQHQALLQSSSQQRLMERLLREAQRGSGASSITQSGNASPMFGDCRSPPAPVEEPTVSASSKSTAEFLQNNTDWLWDWSGHSFAGAGRSKRAGHRSGCSKSAASSTTGSLSLRKSGLMRRHAATRFASDSANEEAMWQNWANWCWLSVSNASYSPLVVSAVTHAVCFLVGAASVFVIMRSCSKQRHTLGN